MSGSPKRKEGNKMGKKRYGMTNFIGNNESSDDQDEQIIPDEVFDEISKIYFNEVFLRHQLELKNLRKEIKSLKDDIQELKDIIKGVVK